MLSIKKSNTFSPKRIVYGLKKSIISPKNFFAFKTKF